MDKFTRLKTIEKKEEKAIIDSTLFDGDYHKIIKFEGWDIIEENDCVICIPIFMERSQIMVRQEYIPTYKKRDGGGLYLHVISGTIEDTETPEICLRRELIEEGGIKLRDNYPIVFDKSLYMTKSSTGKYHICIMELYDDDYVSVQALGDGSVDEAKSRSAFVNFQDIDKLIPQDVITELSILKTMKKLNM